MSRLFLGIWRWSPLLTLPLTLLFLYWSWHTLQRYQTFGVRFDAGRFASAVSLHRIGLQEFRHELNISLQTVLDPLGENSDPVPGVRRINLVVPEASLGELNSRLPDSGFEYVKGGLYYDGRLRRVKLRYRGDYLNHWSGYKKSWRVKTRRQDLFEGMRRFNLIVPKGVAQLHNYLGYRLAEAMGVMGPHSELVEVILNGRNQGLHELVEQLDESTLRRHGVMPGDLYVGELTAKDAYLEVDHHVFRHPGLWDKVAVNNHYPEAANQPLQKLTRLINSEQTPEVQEQLAEMLDMPAWGNFFAYITLAQTFHYGESHNWRLYFDPARSRFVPVVWDPVSWFWLGGTDGKAVPDIITSRLHELLYQNTDFLLARQRALQRFYESGDARRFLQRMTRTAGRASKVIARDPNLIHGNPKASIRAMKQLVAAIEDVFDQLEEEFLGKHGGSASYARLRGNGGIALEVSGRQPLVRLTLEYQQPLLRDLRAEVGFWRNDQPVTADISGAVSVSGTKLTIELPLISRHRQYREGIEPLRSRKLRLEPAYYELSLQGVAAGNRLLDVTAEWLNGRQQSLVERDSLAQTSFDDAYPVVSERPLQELQTWRGQVRVEGLWDSLQPLLIEPGTTVYMGEGAVLRLNHRLLAQGNAEQPVRFVPAPENQKPWGAVVLNGPGADGSRLQYTEFSGGSGVKQPLYEYSGMFSVHDVDGVQIIGCRFSDNRVVDDAVHAVYSELRFIDSHFERAKSDALDLDISQAVIEGSSFAHSGNDAVDLMTSKAVIVDTLLTGSGDKGISVGEGSRMVAIGNRIEGNSIGVQSKDGSVAVLVNTSLVDNAVSLDAYKKNWRYGSGGHIYAYLNRVEGPGAGITADKHSRIRINDSYVSELPVLGRKQRQRIILEPSVDALSPRNAKLTGFKRFPEERQKIGGLGRGFWNRVDLGRRGAAADGN
jgi:hypothetical protein